MHMAPLDNIIDMADNSNEAAINNLGWKQQQQEEEVKRLLAVHHGSTRNAEVQAAMKELMALWQPEDGTRIGRSHLLQGEFICHTLPEFPGRLGPSPDQKDPHAVRYTLGRLSFGIFQPHNLICTVRAVRQSIRRTNASNSSNNSFDYPVSLDLTIHTPQGVDLPAVMTHRGVCYDDDDNDTNNNSSQKQQEERAKFPNRLHVIFQGSTLAPTKAVYQDPELLNVWNETFRHAYTNAEANRGFLSRTLQSLLVWWFQMTLPADDPQASNPHAVSFEMKRSPRGYLDVLYVSDTLRITRGNRGTVVVVERIGSTTTTSNNNNYNKNP